METPEIQDYHFGRMSVDGKRYTQDLILLPDRVVANWWRKEGHRLGVEDLEAVFAAAPQVLVVGTGAYGLMEVPEETRRALEAAGIKLRTARTGEAWRLYNGLRKKQRTAGAFHLTC
ncbi:MAG TPA: hypothetical protein EYH30_04625 [Anaerolineales bacterium]|nr:hypothetical protein [Anaerolineae bacterium]HIQ01399.1 hypothetical protein [Anaerolineales bacterium]